MKKVLLTGIIVLFVHAISFSQTADEKEILSILKQQDSCWNRGNIEGFMQTYWKSDSLMFIGKSGVTYGWQQTLDNYKKGYPDTASMGKLDFKLIQIKKISRDYCNVVGKWHLSRTKGDLQGHFTLLLRKIKGKWMIVQDHSS